MMTAITGKDDVLIIGTQSLPRVERIEGLAINTGLTLC